MPGPACYGHGGPLTITDMNFFLGRLPDQYFPFPLNKKIVEIKLSNMAKSVKKTLGISKS